MSLDAALIALGVVFLAELGDKSQLIALTFAARGRPIAVLAGISVAVAILQALAVGAGAALGSMLPDRPIQIVAGIAFLGFAAWTLRADDDDDPTVERIPPAAHAIAIAAGTAFFVAELGDKTQLATVALASTNGALGTWLGSLIGQVAADALAIIIGARIGSRLPERALRLASAGAFVLFGVLLLVGLG